MLEVRDLLFLLGEVIAEDRRLAQHRALLAAAAKAQTKREGAAQDQQDESFTIDHISGNAGDEKIQISAFGHQQVFNHVSKIYAYGGAGPLHAWGFAAELGVRQVIVPLGNGAATLSVTATAVSVTLPALVTRKLGSLGCGHSSSRKRAYASSAATVLG